MKTKIYEWERYPEFALNKSGQDDEAYFHCEGEFEVPDHLRKEWHEIADRWNALQDALYDIVRGRS